MARLANLFNKAHPQFPNGSQEHAYHHGPSSPTRLQVDAASSPHVHRSQAPHHPPYESQDFCNAFWGDIGYEVLMSRVKQSSRMLDDLKTWYKERSAIELEYSKKLFRLSKSPVLSQATANYEPNGLKAALESVRQSTEKMAHCHAELSGTFRTALYGKFDTFINTRDSAKKNVCLVSSHPFHHPAWALFNLVMLGFACLKPQATVEKLRKILVDLHVIHEKVCTLHVGVFSDIRNLPHGKLILSAELNVLNNFRLDGSSNRMRSPPMDMSPNSSWSKVGIQIKFPTSSTKST
jgi:hypothetical protein